MRCTHTSDITPPDVPSSALGGASPSSTLSALAVTRPCKGSAAGSEHSFTTTDPRQEYCDAACSNRARQRRHYGRRREAQDALLSRYEREVHRAVACGHLEPFEAIELLVAPSEQVLELLREAA